MPTLTGSDDEDSDPTSSHRHHTNTLTLIRASMAITDVIYVVGNPQPDHAALTTVIVIRAALTAAEIALTNWRERRR